MFYEWKFLVTISKLKKVDSVRELLRNNIAERGIKDFSNTKKGDETTNCCRDTELSAGVYTTKVDKRCHQYSKANSTNV